MIQFVWKFLYPERWYLPSPLTDIQGKVNVYGAEFSAYRSTNAPGDSGYQFLDYKFEGVGHPIYVHKENDQCLGTLLLESIIMGGLGIPTVSVEVPFGINYPLLNEFYYLGMTALGKVYAQETKLGFVQKAQWCGKMNPSSMPTPLDCTDNNRTINNAILNFPITKDDKLQKERVDRYKFTNEEMDSIVADVTKASLRLDTIMLIPGTVASNAQKAITKNVYPISLGSYMRTLLLLHTLKLFMLGHPDFNLSPLIETWEMSHLGKNANVEDFNTRRPIERLGYDILNTNLGFYLSVFIAENCAVKKDRVVLLKEVDDFVSVFCN